MKRSVLLLGFILLGLASMAQSGRDFSAFGNQSLEQKNTVEIYPNPSVDFLNVKIENSDLEKTELVVHSIIGSRFKVEIEKTEDAKFKIDVRDLPPGYYLLSIKDPVTEFSKTFKFLKR
jgi:hypothetical protein